MPEHWVAADEIERLTAERDRERNRYHDMLMQKEGYKDLAADRAAEIERLRAALERIVKESVSMRAVEIARVALGAAHETPVGIAQAVLENVVAVNFGAFLTSAVDHIEHGGNEASCEVELTEGTRVKLQIKRLPFKPAAETTACLCEDDGQGIAQDCPLHGHGNLRKFPAWHGIQRYTLWGQDGALRPDSSGAWAKMEDVMSAFLRAASKT